METGLASFRPLNVLTETISSNFDAITATLPMEMGHSIGPTVVLCLGKVPNFLIQHLYVVIIPHMLVYLLDRYQCSSPHATNLSMSSGGAHSSRELMARICSSSKLLWM